MATVSILEDLYHANDWARAKCLRLCDGLTDAQLDQPRELGPGSLRATLFHVLAAEEIWLERWIGAPARPFPIDPAGIPLAEIDTRLEAVAAKRQELIDRERANGWRRIVRYTDLRGVEHARPLAGLLLHVANHGVHHRAQILNYLRDFGRTAPIGLEFLFYKLALPSVPQDPATIESFNKQGIAIADEPGDAPAWDPAMMNRYFGYHDWAMNRIFDLAAPLPDAALDREFAMGPGSLRKLLTHLHDVERFWTSQWTGDGTGGLSNAGLPLKEIRDSWSAIADRRRRWLPTVDTDAVNQEIAVAFGTPPMKFRKLETMLQVCVHGTHHRAQAINMLRHSGVTVPGFDLPIWLKEIGE